MKIKLVEQSGMSVKALLTRPDLSGGLQLECNIAEDGASHSRRGANYGANKDTNSMAAHLNNEHPEYSRDPLAIKFSNARTGPKGLEHQVRPAVETLITSSTPTWSLWPQIFKG